MPAPEPASKDAVDACDKRIDRLEQNFRKTTDDLFSMVNETRIQSAQTATAVEGMNSKLERIEGKLDARQDRTLANILAWLMLAAGWIMTIVFSWLKKP